MKLIIFLTEFSLNWQYVSIGSGNGSAPHWWKAITEPMVTQFIDTQNASPGLNEINAFMRHV